MDESLREEILQRRQQRESRRDHVEAAEKPKRHLPSVGKSPSPTRGDRAAPATVSELESELDLESNLEETEDDYEDPGRALRRRLDLPHGVRGAESCRYSMCRLVAE